MDEFFKTAGMKSAGKVVCKRGFGNVFVSSIAVPSSRSNKFLTDAGTFAQ